MDILLFISKFIYRIRYKLVIGTLLTTLLVAYFSRFTPKTYTVNTSIYTGFASNSGLEETKTDWAQLNNSFDNLINLIKSKSTLEKVSIELFARNMFYGDSFIDNQIIKAQTFRDLMKIVPDEIKKLVDKNSLEKTINNIKEYTKTDPDGFFFNLFNQRHPHYSYNTLKDIAVRRVGNSDIIELSYHANDPGIALNTVKLIYSELIKNYDNLRYKPALDVAQYYEQELMKCKKILNEQENALTEYSVENKIINYQEQTKSLAGSLYNYEDRYELVQQELNSSADLLKKFDNQILLRQEISEKNEEFIKALDNISAINRKITEIEIFNTNNNEKNNEKLSFYKNELKIAEEKVSQLGDLMNQYKISKEGVALEKIVEEWLAATIRHTKAQAELAVLNERKIDYERSYENFSPIGTQLKRKEREINITEQSYLNALAGLNNAKQKEKNIQLTSATLTMISPPTFPLYSDGGKQKLFIIAAFLGSFIFIIGCCLVIEISDRTLRDPERSKRLTGLTVLGAFMGRKQLKYRGFRKAINRKTISHICTYIDSTKSNKTPLMINLISIEKGEGKSFIAQYMIDYWKSISIKVKYISYEKDFIPVSKKYMYTEGIEYLIDLHDEKFDILLIEYPPLTQLSIPQRLLKEADMNLLIANAKRVWKESDSIQIQFLKEKSGNTPIQLLLNNAYREIVEGFIGQLPPYIEIGGFHRLFMLGFTAENAAVK